MKFFKSIILSIALLALVIVMIFFNSEKNELDPKNDEAIIESSSAKHSDKKTDPSINLAEYMNKIQHHCNLLYSAGKKEELREAKFHFKRIEQAMLTIEKANLKKDDQDISMLIKGFGLNPLKIFKNDLMIYGFKNFDKQINTLISSCNTCHDNTQKSSIQITLPTEVNSNQTSLNN